MENLKGAGIKAQRVKREFDHSVWMGFIADSRSDPPTLGTPVCVLFTG